MNLIIEVFDGVAYAVEKADYYIRACQNCCLDGKCNYRCVRHSEKTYYRRLTAKEREEVMKALGRGME